MSMRNVSSSMLQPVNYNGKKVHGSIARLAQGNRNTAPKLYPGNTGTKTDLNKIVKNVVRNCIEFLSEMTLLIILVPIMYHVPFYYQQLAFYTQTIMRGKSPANAAPN